VIILEEEKQKHWSDTMVIDWSDTRYRKNVHKLEVTGEGWLYKLHESGWKEPENYYIKCKSKSSKDGRDNVTSTDGRLGSCVCDSFTKTAPTSVGKVPCLHLWECRDRMFKKVDESRKKARDYQRSDHKYKDEIICEHLKKTKGDPNSLLNDEKFVKKMIKGKTYV
jgi:hypothetical protein